MYVTVLTEFRLGRIVVIKRWETSIRALVVTIWSWLTPYQEILMNKDQVKGKIEEVKGKIKEAAGVILDDKGMEVEGNVQKNVGKIQKGVGNIEEDIKKGN